MSARLIERLEAAAKRCDELQAWHANAEDSDCEPHWSIQGEAMDDAKAIREAIALLRGKGAAHD